MKISLNWLRDFLDLNISPPEIADILTSLGLEVEGIEPVKSTPVDLDKVVTGFVSACSPIPDTDHLSATQVEISDTAEPSGIRTLSIVCGAPNVAQGQKVWVALSGAQVYSKDGTLFTIGERKVRGVPSQGMICAQDELGIGSDHSGIMVLPPDTPLGITAASQYGAESDVVIEIGLTPNRADATNHQGVARDLLAALRHQRKQEIPFRTPDISAFPDNNGPIPIEVVVENSADCRRFTGVCITGMKVKESPDWLKNRLNAIGIRPINNVVDVTNYVRAELGQPLHAYDQRKIANQTIIVKNLPEGTPFLSLDEKERKLFADDLMVCDGNSYPMCIGGVFGGFDSGVKDDTTGIFLESAWFHPRTIRRSMLRHNLRTDAAWSFEKGVDPNGTLTALKRAALLICELTGGQISGSAFDHYPDPVAPAKINISYPQIHSLIGEAIPTDDIKKILQALDIRLENETADTFTAIIPTNKPDVTRPADLIEEILRVHGLDTVPMPNAIRSSMEIAPKPDPERLKNQVADQLAALGLLECMNMSLSNAAWFQGEKAILPLPEGAAVRVHNTANQGLDCLRPTLVTGGLETIRHNQNRQRPDLRLFEFGKVYRRDPKAEATQANQAATTGFEEELRLGIWLTGAFQSENWQKTPKKTMDFFTLKSVVHQVLNRLGISGYQESVLQMEPLFRSGLKYHRGPLELVSFGPVSPTVTKRFDLKNEVFYADFHFENIVRAFAGVKVQYSELSRFPTVRRDLALVIESATPYTEIEKIARKTLKSGLKEVNLFDVFEDESKIGKGKKSYAVSFVFEDKEKTLQEQEIENWMNQLTTSFETKLQAQVRK